MSSAETLLKKSLEKVGNAVEAPKRLISGGSGKAPSENSDPSAEDSKNQSDGSLTKSSSDDPTTSGSGTLLKKSLEKVGHAIAETPGKLVSRKKSTNDDTEDDLDKFDTIETGDDSDDEIDVHKYSCAFLPKSGGVLQQGSFVVTGPFLYFISSYKNTKFKWIWDDITVKLSKTLGAIANSITIVYTGEDEEHPKTYKFVMAPGVRKKAFARISQFTSVEDTDGCCLSDISDETLNKMDITVKKILKGVSIKDFLEAFLDRKEGADKTPIYEEFMIADGRRNIQVDDFVTAEEGKEFVGEWCGEKYQRKRTVRYTFTKHGYEGNATITQYVRVEGDDKVVIQGTTAVTGPPYTDYMLVHHRSTASLVGGENVAVLAGMFVEFVKSTMLEGKIGAIAMAEGTKTHLQLYELGKKYCYEHLGAEEVTCEKSRGIEEDALATTRVPYYGLLAFFSGLLALFYQLMADIAGKPRHKPKEGAIHKDINSGQAKLNKIAELADEMDDETISGKEKKIRPQFKVVHQCLDKVLDQLQKSESET